MHQLKNTTYQPNPSLTRAVILIIFLLLQSTNIFASCDIAGSIQDEKTGNPIRRIQITALRSGRSVAVTASSDNDGSFIISSLEPGIYAVAVHAVEGYRPTSVPYLKVIEGQVTKLDVKLRRSIAVEGDSWVQSCRSFSQSFQAGGLALTGLTIKAFGPARRLSVQLLEGQGHEGKPAGPIRITEPVGGEGSCYVAWSASETMTRPGRPYTLKITDSENHLWIAALAGQGDVYPLGNAYFNDIPRPHSDLGIIISEDNDDLRTNYSLAGHGRMYRAKSAGQEFIALSRNVTFCSAMLQSIGETPVHVRFSIHQDELRGKQIGPSKSTQASESSTVAWCRDEVTLKPGGRYYLHIESLSGNEFLTGYQDSAYAMGSAAFNGKYDEKKDLIATVAGQITQNDFESLNAHHRHKEFCSLIDPSFEEDMKGWQKIGDAGSVVSCDEGIIPAWGTKMFGWTKRREGEGTRTVIYQSVNVKPEHWYSFSGYVHTSHKGGRSSDVKIRLIGWSQGQVHLQSPQQMESSQWYATEGRWSRGSVQFMAQSEQIKVGFELEQRFALDESSLYIDGALLEEIVGD